MAVFRPVIASVSESKSLVFSVPSTLSISFQCPYQTSARLHSSGTNGVTQSGVKHLQGNARRKTQIMGAVAVPSTQSMMNNLEYRMHLAESYGYTQIGEPLPDDVKLKDIVETFPKELMEIDDAKAWTAVFKTVASYGLGLYAISQSPWFLLPLAWTWTGTAASGFFAIGHECGHKSFFNNKLVEDIVGTLAFLPLIYPFEAWRFEHERHHAKTNMLSEDTGWHPIEREFLESAPLVRKAIIFSYGLFRPWMTIAHWLLWHFDLKQFRQNEVKWVKISLACVYAFMGIGWPLLIHMAGFVGWINFWFIPWLVYHFWMSVVTMIHHTAPYIPFKPHQKWHAAGAQLNGTVHCDYPSWVEFLIHDINYHVPHHILPRIPYYNLRSAHELMKAKWGKYMNTATLNWRLMKTIMTTCHVYDEDQNYVSFDEIAPNESHSVTFIKKLMPDWS